ncbi:hypothetical protein ACFB49_27550 [Sphingomonas sp. DBB INV C78]
MWSGWSAPSRIIARCWREGWDGRANHTPTRHPELVSGSMRNATVLESARGRARTTPLGASTNAAHGCCNKFSMTGLGRRPLSIINPRIVAGMDQPDDIHSLR